jgi:hypothetical protein
MLVRLLPNVWVRLPGTPIELYAECEVVVRRSDDGTWNMGFVPGTTVPV